MSEDNIRKQPAEENMITNTELVICTVETQAKHPELFHYTNHAAFESIVKSKTFWASHYADMADRTEVLLMRDQLPAAVGPRFEEIVAPLNRHDRRLFKAAGGGKGVAKDFVESLYGATFLSKGGFTALDAFMVSFSTHADDGEFERKHGLLSQWERYAVPEGFCLVFDTPAMARCLEQEMDSRYWVRLTLDPVRYAHAPVEELFPELVNASADTLRQFLSGVRYPEMAVPEFLAGATLLKNADFRPEREVRIVAIPGSKLLRDRAAKEHPDDFKVLPLPEVRTRLGTMRRYVPIFEGLGLTLPIKRVIVGPSRMQEENAAFARSLVPGDVPVSCSQCVGGSQPARPAATGSSMRSNKRPMAPTTLRLVNATSDQHVEAVMDAMRTLGPPTIPVVDCGDCYMALDGSHRSMAAAKLGIRPTLNVLASDELVAADDLGTDCFQGRRSAGWIAEQYRGAHNLVLDINPDGTLAFREAPEGHEEE